MLGSLTKLLCSSDARNKYNAHKGSAKQRGVGFELTFNEWASIWDASGKFSQRGRHRGMYVMSRFGDKGPYAVGNVHIQTSDENRAEVRKVLQTPDERRVRKQETTKCMYIRREHKEVVAGMTNKQIIASPLFNMCTARGRLKKDHLHKAHFMLY